MAAIIETDADVTITFYLDWIQKYYDEAMVQLDDNDNIDISW